MLTQKIQHASSIIAERHNQRIWHLDAHSQSLTWSQAILKQTCKDDQAQDNYSD